LFSKKELHVVYECQQLFIYFSRAANATYTPNCKYIYGTFLLYLNCRFMFNLAAAPFIFSSVTIIKHEEVEYER